MNYERALSIADRMSERCDGRYHMGAVIMQGSRIISRGHAHHSGSIPTPLYQSHPRSSKHHSIHAEMDALKRALLDKQVVNGATMVVSGFSAAGNRPISCRPCRSCLRVLKEKGFRYVVYRTQDGFHATRLGMLDDDAIVCSSCDQTITGWSQNGDAHR